LHKSKSPGDLLRSLYVHVLIGIALGVLLGLVAPAYGGAAAVTGSGFITLAATLSAFPAVPVAGLTLLVGVDRFMSEARATTNLMGTPSRRWPSRNGAAGWIWRKPGRC
jgi:Na+/H+-dicarboxylate symporter